LDDFADEHTFPVSPGDDSVFDDKALRDTLADTKDFVPDEDSSNEEETQTASVRKESAVKPDEKSAFEEPAEYQLTSESESDTDKNTWQNRERSG